MAAAKKKSHRQGIVSKLANAGLILLGLSRPLEIAFAPVSVERKVEVLLNESTFGLSTGAFNLKAGLRLYGPGIAATSIGFLKSYLLRKFPVRR